MAEEHPPVSKKLPIPRLITTAYTAKTRKRNLSNDEKLAKRNESRARDRTRINIGEAYPTWRQLRDQKGFKSDAELAVFLIERYHADSLVTTSTQAKHWLLDYDASASQPYPVLLACHSQMECDPDDRLST
ncbi:uncharacterized protein si:ch211-40k21.5 [Etheostoma cragini]|uniref:uncharacterized protein si:ch211-40k21.5 n=1 Tax=Etheostoma cragini TaxID=417921 RepID=UPI00155DF61B|nr:uncharacterized protein si:ch211-40k21.5 [Etheostoma cragini]